MIWKKQGLRGHNSIEKVANDPKALNGSLDDASWARFLLPVPEQKDAKEVADEAELIWNRRRSKDRHKTKDQDRRFAAPNERFEFVAISARFFASNSIINKGKATS